MSGLGSYSGIVGSSGRGHRSAVPAAPLRDPRDRGQRQRGRAARRQPRLQARRRHTRTSAAEAPEPERDGQQPAERGRGPQDGPPSTEQPHPRTAGTASTACPSCPGELGGQRVPAGGEPQRAPGAERGHRRGQPGPRQAARGRARAPAGGPGPVKRTTSLPSAGTRAQRPHRIGGEVPGADPLGAPARPAGPPANQGAWTHDGTAGGAPGRKAVPARRGPPRPAAASRRGGRRGRARGGRQLRHLVDPRAQHPLLAGEDGLARR